MGNTDIDEIKKRLNIEDIISEYIKLKRAGSGFTALCPFHSEKSPSFHVSPDRSIYKCFGCGESGDIFSFVQKFENLDFPQVKKRLAEKAGVVLEDFSSKSLEAQKEISQKKEHEKRLLDLLNQATNFFQISLLKNLKAKSYLKKRGVDEKMAKKFRLGFALDDWSTLENFLIEKKFSREEILEVGLTKKNEQDSIYDRFRNRIIFPIFDEKGNPIAFSGRDFSGSDKVAKYLNSPQTLFFDKSSILFGFNFAKIEARKRKYFILVEGQMDLVMNHKIGFENTVASSGTSLTESHLKKMSHFSKNLIFAFDSDKAGIEAAFRGIKKAFEMDFVIKIIDISKNNDPADIILKDEKKWKSLVENSKNIIDFYINKITISEKSIKEKNKELCEKIYPFIKSIKNKIEKDYYIKKILENFNFTTRENVLLEIEKSEDLIEYNEENNTEVSKKKFDIFSKNNIIEEKKKRILKQLTAIYYWQKNLKKSEPWVDPKKILKSIEKSSSEEVFKKIVQLKDNSEYVDSLIFEVEVLYGKGDIHSLEFDIASMEKRLEEIVRDEEVACLRKKIDLCNESEKKEILEKIQKIMKEKNGG